MQSAARRAVRSVSVAAAAAAHMLVGAPRLRALVEPCHPTFHCHATNAWGIGAPPLGRALRTMGDELAQGQAPSIEHRDEAFSIRVEQHSGRKLLVRLEAAAPDSRLRRGSWPGSAPCP